MKHRGGGGGGGGWGGEQNCQVINIMASRLFFPRAGKMIINMKNRGGGGRGRKQNCHAGNH